MTFVAWATLVAAVVAAGVGVFSAVLQRRTGREATAEVDRRAKREELMRELRWAAELAVDADDARAALGVTQLRALSSSPLLDEEMLPQVEAALAAVAGSAAETVDEIRERGDDPAAVESDDLPGPESDV